MNVIEIQRVIARMDATIKDMLLQRDALAGLLPQEKKARKGFDRAEFDRKCNEIKGRGK